MGGEVGAGVPQIPGEPLGAVCPAAVAAVVAAEGALPPGSRRHDLPTPGPAAPAVLRSLCVLGASAGWGCVWGQPSGRRGEGDWGERGGGACATCAETHIEGVSRGG